MKDLRKYFQNHKKTFKVAIFGGFFGYSFHSEKQLYTIYLTKLSEIKTKLKLKEFI